MIEIWGYSRVSNRLNQLRTMFDNAVLFSIRADHKTCGVVQEQKWALGLFTKMNKLRSFDRTLWCDGAIIGNDTNVATHFLPNRKQ